MEMKDLTKSGAFAAIVLVIVAVLSPFAVEQIGEITGAWKLSVSGTFRRFIAGDRNVAPKRGAPRQIDWGRCIQGLTEFTQWTENCNAAAISLPPMEVEQIIVREAAPKECAVWLPVISSCSPAEERENGISLSAHRRGYVFIAGFGHPFYEGTLINPSKAKGLCGYEILSVGERTVWLRVVYEENDVSPVGAIRRPEFTRMDGDGLVRGTRRYVVRDAFPISAGGWMMLDSFMPPSGALFKILDCDRRVVMSLVCIVIGEKGNR